MKETIINKFAEAEVLIDDKAFWKIKNHENSLKLTESLIKDLKFSGENILILTGEMVEKFLNTNKGISKSVTSLTSTDTQLSKNTSIKPIKTEYESDIISSSQYKGTDQNKLIDESPFNFQVLRDASRKSYTNGEIKDFSAYFSSRYHKLKEMLQRKKELKSPQPIQELENIQDTVNLIGMVNDIRNTKNNHKLIEVEDETGTASVLIHNENHSLFENAERVVKDEVLGVVGSRKGSLILASELINPGTPRIDEKPMDFSVVFLSDTHIGSSTFLEDAFNNFIKWINGEYGDAEQQNIANNVRYLVVAGDIVDGIGVYPHQDKELTIKDIYKQYEEAARLFGEIDDVQIIITPGNHDAGRLAEPQPAINEEYASDLYKLKNVEFVSNPSLVSLDGINVLIYHGRSFDDFAMTVKGMSHQQTDLIMKELLEKRHLAPIYGERTPLASEVEDHMVIEEIPDVFHTGHVHINSYKKYKGIHLINSGTFQSQTEFQKIYNIVPTCAQVPVLNQGTMKILKFT